MLAGLIVALILLILVIWNLKALFGFLSIKEAEKRVSALALAAWTLSIISPWTGPLLLSATPLSLVLGVWAWLRLPRSPLSYRRSVIPARMAIVNSLGVSLQVAVIFGAFYLAFGSILRVIIWEFWQYKDAFRDYIVT